MDKKTLKKRLKAARMLNALNAPSYAGFCYAAFLVTVLILAAFYLQTFFYLILVLMIGFPIISYNLSKYVFERLEVKLKLTGDESRDRSSFIIVETVNQSFIPLASYEFTLNVSSSLYGGQKPVTYSFMLKARDNNTMKFPLQFDKNGIYEVKITSFGAYDFFHIFKFHRDIELVENITVLPDCEPSDRLKDSMLTEGFDEFEENEKKGIVTGNVTDVREYRPGDRLSRIHWKLTEKMDKLMVKENEATASNRFVILLELYQPSLEKCNEMYEAGGLGDESSFFILDKAIEEAWAVSMELINAGQSFQFMYYSKTKDDFDIHDINDKAGLTEAMTKAFYTPAYDTPDLALSVYERAGMNKGTLIHVN
ncbi:MAG: DUF58 domain-containing protein [Lachnospiraceae bacterium]|nr:DUF58 domain-containing protein [Lachnospiraceae bacterium]